MAVAALVALCRLLEASLVKDARTELRLEAADPVAVARDEAISEDLEAMSELTDEPTEEAVEEAALASEARELLIEEPTEAAEEEAALAELAADAVVSVAVSVTVVVWA